LFFPRTQRRTTASGVELRFRNRSIKVAYLLYSVASDCVIVLDGFNLWAETGKVFNFGDLENQDQIIQKIVILKITQKRDLED